MNTNTTVRREEGSQCSITAQLNVAFSKKLALVRKLIEKNKPVRGADAHDGIRTIYAIQFFITIFLLALLLL